MTETPPPSTGPAAAPVKTRDPDAAAPYVGAVIVVDVEKPIQEATDLAGIVTFLYQDGSLNASVFLPHGGRTSTFTGLWHASQVGIDIPRWRWPAPE